MSRRTKAKSKYPSVDDATVDNLFARDPTRGAYGEWMVRQVAAGEHHDDVLEAVLSFHRCKDRLPKEQRDLYGHEDVGRVLAAVEGVGATSKRQRRMRSRGYSVVASLPNVTFYLVKSYEGVRALGRDTKWCITKRGDYKSYSDKAIVVAVSKLREKRDAYSKFAILTTHAISVNPDKFFSWERLKAISAKGFEVDWRIWDAQDRNPYHYGQYVEPLKEILDMLAGERGATDRVLSEALGGLTRIDLWRDTLHRLRGRVVPTTVIEVAEIASRERLFNPLSMLDHPSIRSMGACERIWKVARKSAREALDKEALEQLARRPAINMPDLLSMYWDRARWGGYRPEELLKPLFGNGRLSAETKERVADLVRTDVLRLPERVG